VVFSRSIPIGVSGPDWINKLSFELKRSLETYMLEFGKATLARLVLCGGGIHSADLNKGIKDKLRDTIDILDISPYLSKLLHTGPEQVSIYATAYGLILAHQNESFQSCDLLHPRLFAVEPWRMPLRFRQLAMGIGFAAVLVLILYGILFLKQRKLSQLQSEYAKYHSLVAQTEQVTASTAIIRSWKQGQVGVMDILQNLSTIWSDEAYLQVLTFDRSKDITLSGLAASNQAVATLLTKFNQSPAFIGTKFTYIRASKRNPTYPVEFGISMKYKSRSASSSLPVSGGGQ